MCNGNSAAMVNILWSQPEERAAIVHKVRKEVDQECAKLCSKEKTTFRIDGIKNLKDVRFSDQQNELQVRAPVFCELLTAAGCNKRNLKRNKMKTGETTIPSLLTAAGILLMTRSERMNTQALLNAIILRRAGAKKLAFKSLSARNIVVSYNTMLCKQLELAQETSNKICEWTIEDCNTKDLRTVSSDCANETDSEFNNLLDEWDGDISEIKVIEEELVAPHKLSGEKSIPETLSTLAACADQPPAKEDVKSILRRRLLQSMGTSTKSDMECAAPVREIPKDIIGANTKQEPHSFYVVSDNLDIRNKARHTTRLHKNQDHHLFHIVAIRKRIPTKRLVSTVPNKADPNSMPPVVAFLPTENDNAALKSEFKMHVGRVLSRLVKDLDWMQQHFTNKAHKFQGETKKKVESVSMLCWLSRAFKILNNNHCQNAQINVKRFTITVNCQNLCMTFEKESM